MPRSPYEIDHCLPFAVWSNNDLWNLFPTHHKANNQKRDMLPTAELLMNAKERIFDWWDNAYGTPGLEETFQQEAKATLPLQSKVETLSNLELFSALNIQRIRLKDSQQVKEWMP